MCQAGLSLSIRLAAWRRCQVLVHRPRDHVEIQPLGALRRVEHELRQALGRRVAQPLLDGQAVALRLADLLRLFVEEQLVGEAIRRRAAEDAADAARQPHRIDQVLAGHLVIDVERVPAHRPVGLPLQLAAAALHRGLIRLAALRVAPDHRSGCSVVPLHRHLHDAPGARVQRQDRRVGGTAFRPERRQDHRHHLVVAFQHADQRRIEPTGGVIFGGGREFVFESERVQERAQAGVVMRTEARRASRTDRGCG